MIGSNELFIIVLAICLLLLFVVFIIVMWRTGRLRKVEAAVVAPIRNTIRRRRVGNFGAIGYKEYTVSSKLNRLQRVYDKCKVKLECINLRGLGGHDSHFRLFNILLKTKGFFN